MTDSPKKVNPFMSLVEADKRAREQESKIPPAALKLDTHTDSTHELAHINTESMSPSDPRGPREKTTVIKAQQRAESLVLETGEQVRALCDRIDSLIENNENLLGPALVDLRNYVQRLMVTLKEQPEFDGILIDKDVRNVMRFIRATRQEALDLREIKTEKKAVRAANKEKALAQGLNASKLADAFNAILNSRGD